jgi:hypothetical protein
VRAPIPSLIVLCGLAATGCNSPRKPSATPPQAVDEVHAINVLSPPMAADWDGRGGPDGLSVSVHLWQADRVLPVTGRGTLVFTLYEGIIRAGDLDKAKPFQTWTFPGDQLPRYVGRSIAGWGYAFRLPWSRTPGTSAVTLVVRFVPARGAPVQAQPIIIAVRET